MTIENIVGVIVFIVLAQLLYGGYMYIGLYALVRVDNKNSELINWIGAAPGDKLRILVIRLWPLVICAWWFIKHKKATKST
jgi:hypothetical protein